MSPLARGGLPWRSLPRPSRRSLPPSLAPAMGGGGEGGVGAMGDGALETLWSVGARAGRLRSGRPGRGGAEGA
eukprot:1864729-Prymnesium_polylepis.1